MVIEGKKEEIKRVTEIFFEKMGFSVELRDLLIKEETVSLRLRSEEPKVLIGKSGHTLNEIQHLLRAILKRNISDNFFLDIDIDDYKEKKIEYLKETAREVADEVALTKEEKLLEPMVAYERRIIHLELANRPDVITESVGRDPDRRVIIKPRKK